MEALGLVLIMFFHYIADFKLQSREIATTKSSDMGALCYHINIITGTLFFPCWIVFGLKYSAGVGFIMAMFFTVINAVIHGIIDWNIWKGYKRYVAQNLQKYFGEGSQLSSGEMNKMFMDEKLYAEDKEFYDTIGFDGLLHYVTLVLLYAWFI